MARLYTEGFENGSILNDPNLIVGYNVGIGLGSGRNGGYSLGGSSYNNNSRCYRSPLLPNSTNEIWVRTAFNFPNSGTTTILSLGTDLLDEVSVIVGPGTPAQPVTVWVGSTLAITSKILIVPNSWYVLELHYNASSGQVDLKIEGSLQGSFTGTAGSSVSRVFWFASSALNVPILYDDLAINDNTSTSDNSWCGDGYVTALRPNSQGASNTWLRNDTNLASTNNYDRVSEVPPDYDTTYVYSQTVGNYDFYNVADLTGLLPTDIIRRVWVSAYAKEAVASGDQFNLGLLVNSTQYWASTSSVLTTLWQAYQGDVYRINPNTSAAWTQSDVNALQVGIKVV